MNKHLFSMLLEVQNNNKQQEIQINLSKSGKKKKIARKSEQHNLHISSGAAVKLCLGDLLVMGSNPKTASLHMQG